MKPEERAKKILLVEDSRVLAEGMRQKLEKSGYAVATEESGEAAIVRAAEDSTVDLVLMDVELGSRMDGTEAAEHILKNRDIPVVFHSSHAEREVVEKTERINSYGYVLKNSGPAVLETSIKMAFRLHEAYEALEEKDQLVRRKLDALLETENNIETLELNDIIDSEEIQELMNHFFRLTGIGVAVVDTKGKVLVATGWQEICTKFHRVHPEARKHCIESDTILGSGGKPGTFKIYKCKNHMWDISSPIVLGDKQVGSIFLGQFFFDDEEPDYEVFRAQGERYGFDVKKYLDALDRVPRWSHETVDHVMNFYSCLAQLISRQSYSNLKLAKKAEEHRRAEERIEHLLKEKEMFLREVHHRIKNNLNTIRSLLDLQSDELELDCAKDALREASGRVQSMMLLYEKLYRAERHEAVSLREYLPPLIEDIVEIFPDRVPIDLSTDIDDIVLKPKILSTLGIIINELVTNTIKYGCRGRDETSIMVNVKQRGESVRIEYADGGPGLPEEIDAEITSGFGLQLIEMLAKQLGGRLEILREHGAKFLIDFPLPTA